MFLPTSKSIPKLRLKTGDAGWCFSHIFLTSASSCSTALTQHSSWPRAPAVGLQPSKPLLLDGPLLQTAGRCQATWAKSFLLITDCQLILQRKFLSTFLNSWTAFTRIAPSKTSKVQLYTKNIWTLVCATNTIIFYTHFILQTACGHAFTFTKRVFIFFQISSELK